MTCWFIETIPDWVVFKVCSAGKSQDITLRPLGSNCLSLNPSLAFPSCVTLGRLLTSLWSRPGTCLRWLLWGLNELLGFELYNSARQVSVCYYCFQTQGSSFVKSTLLSRLLSFACCFNEEFLKGTYFLTGLVITLSVTIGTSWCIIFNPDSKIQTYITFLTSPFTESFKFNADFLHLDRFSDIWLKVK